MKKSSTRERASGTHQIDWVGLRAGLDTGVENIYCPCQESNPGRQARRFSGSAHPGSEQTKPKTTYILQNF
jgi:hypothetical protein